MKSPSNIKITHNKSLDGRQNKPPPPSAFALAEKNARTDGPNMI
jgi:hypothetical protein